MGLRAWWTSLSRAYQNAFALFAVDVLLLIGSLTRVHPLQLTWDALTGATPNVFEAIVMQLVALLRDMAPGSMVVGGVAIVYGTMFASLLLIHLVVGFGTGFLFDKVPRTLGWSFVSFFTLILVLFVIHFFFLWSAFLTL